MERLGRAGLTVLLKVDDERLAEGGPFWTVVLSGPALGNQGLIRAESASLTTCLHQALTRLRPHPGDWTWLPDFS